MAGIVKVVRVVSTSVLVMLAMIVVPTLMYFIPLFIVFIAPMGPFLISLLLEIGALGAFIRVHFPPKTKAEAARALQQASLVSAPYGGVTKEWLLSLNGNVLSTFPRFVEVFSCSLLI